MKTALQELLSWAKHPIEDGEVNHSLYSKINELMEKEKQQIVDALDNGKSRAYATADGECEVKFGFQFYNETYT